MATTTNYGWTTPNDTDLVKNGASAMRTLGTGVDSTLGTALNNKLHAGLVLIKTQVIGTGVTSVQVTGAFSTTYDNYRIVVSNLDCSLANNAVSFQLGAVTSSYYSATRFFSFAGGGTELNRDNQASAYLCKTDEDNDTAFTMDVMQPFLAFTTSFSGTANTYAQTAIFGGVQQSNTSFTTFTLAPTTGTFTGGTIAVYGYAKD